MQFHFRPIMSFLGSPKSRECLGYKSDDESFDANNKMSPSQTFNREIIQGEGAENGDDLYVAKPHDGSEIPAGNIGCYIPQGRKGTLETLLENQEKQNQTIKNQNQTIKNQNRIIDQLQAKALNNCIVQLIYGLCHAKIVATINNATNLYPGRHLLRFEDVLEDPRVDQATKEHLQHDPTYLSLNRIMNHQFWTVVRTRNTEAHPPFIDLEEIEMMFNQVEPGLQNLSLLNQRAFIAAKAVYEKVKFLDELDELVEIYNEA